MPSTKRQRNPGIIDRIRAASTPEEIDRLVSHALRAAKHNDQTLRLINRAAVQRNLELARP